MTLHDSTIRKIGRALHGDDFVAPLARDLRMRVRSLERILAGQRDAPEGLAAELLTLIDAQRASLASELGLASRPQKRQAALGTAAGDASRA